MREARLKRFYFDNKETLGTITVLTGKSIWVARTLELAWAMNQPNVSCIPLGSYNCAYTRSNRLSTAAGHDVFTYEVLHVPSRSGIRIHASSFFSDLKGCISLGSTHLDINSDGELDLIDSRKTIGEFEILMEHKDFMLIVE